MKKIIAVMICAVLFLTACSATPSETNSSSAATAPETEYESAEVAGAAKDEGASAETEEAEGLGGLSNPDLPDTDRKLTYSASFDINTKQYDADYAKINEELSAVGGYIANEESSSYSSETGKNYGRNSYLSLRVPVDNLNAFMDSLSGIGEVVSKHKSTEDLTSQYYDTDARIEMLNMRKDRLMGYLANATKAEDIVAFEQELSDVLYELDQLQGSKRQMDQLVDYAAVDVTLTELITPETIGADGQPLGDRASDAFSMSMTGVGEFMENFAIFWAAALPVILLIAIFAAIIYAVIRLILWLRKNYYAKHPEKIRQPRPVQQPMYPPYPPQTPPTPPAQQAPPQNTDNPTK
ncbi:DUF4349 domain-containing protein [Christensenella tenuis]|jgi:hypothetical protein|uniref:DUF4349 domain-containing protein n=1 Tax=Christensenella tenuis TaxID=2763033 RepID=A0ABR7EDN5_9FIRM|nr:DUF4349 domain-containing protein [Christensenella tenuis]MBC5647898.1 DUF4349 domain-containing protein [Christensenella tenuis]